MYLLLISTEKEKHKKYNTEGLKRIEKKLLASGFVHILKLRLLQKEPFHCWVPALVFKKEGSAC